MTRNFTFSLLLMFLAALFIGASISNTPTVAEETGLSIAEFPQLAMDHDKDDEHHRHGRHHDDEDECDEEGWDDDWDGMEEFEMMMVEVEMFSDLLGLIDQYTAIAADADKAAIAAVLAVDEYLDEEQSVALLNEMLGNPRVKPAVKRAIHLKMLDIVEDDAAKQHLRALILGDL